MIVSQCRFNTEVYVCLKIISFVESDTVPSQKFIIADSYNKIISDKIKKKFPDAHQFFSRINDSGIDTRTMVYDSLDSTFVKSC